MVFNFKFVRRGVGAIPIANVKSAAPVTSGAEREHAIAANRL
jgi:hypothetical protein